MGQPLDPKSTLPWYASWWITLYYHWTQHQMSWILLYVKALCLVTDQMIRKSCGDDWFLRPFFFHFIHSVFNMDGQWQRVCLGMCRFGGWVWMIFQCDHTILCRRSVRWRLDATLFPNDAGTQLSPLPMQCCYTRWSIKSWTTFCWLCLRIRTLCFVATCRFLSIKCSPRPDWTPCITSLWTLKP